MPSKKKLTEEEQFAKVLDWIFEPWEVEEYDEAEIEQYEKVAKDGK